MNPINNDCMVHIDRLLKHFDEKHLWSNSRLYGGNFGGSHQKPDGRVGAKWYEPVYKKITGFDNYPEHAKGAGYILSRSLAEGIARQPLDFWAFVSCEDIAVGFWFIAANKSLAHAPVAIKPRCDTNTVLDHYITPDIMLDRWQKYTDFGDPCASDSP